MHHNYEDNEHREDDGHAEQLSELSLVSSGKMRRGRSLPRMIQPGGDGENGADPCEVIRRYSSREHRRQEGVERERGQSQNGRRGAPKPATLRGSQPCSTGSEPGVTGRDEREQKHGADEGEREARRANNVAPPEQPIGTWGRASPVPS